MISAMTAQVENNILSDAGMTVLIGLVVVFSALIVLTLIFWLFGVVAGSGTKPSPQPTVTATAPPKPASIQKPAAPVVEAGISDETVAVIAAAVAAMSDGDTHYTVRRISAAHTGHTRPVWAAAGIAENTQPF